FPPIAAVRLAKNAAGLTGGDETMPTRPLNGVLKAVFGLERSLLAAADLPFGVSILLIAQRRP
ncbi:MAG: SAM-dependent methyltransferase, partial [Phenylobacterium sp.]|nr:SAM-dependent methyltransferase [Phenylobacterium sp.]